jgi:exopolyphosphatase/guanosine-5'-triphosphate,3'-diphosphate pyrophosphatase
MILAGIDIGTNSLRLLIAQIDRNIFREIYADRKTTRLGKGLERTGKLDRDAEERSLNAIEDFTKIIRKHKVQYIAAIGTSALRNASNANEFIKEVKRKTGLTIIVISGEDEARLTLMGVARSLENHRKISGEKLENALIIDIGGGSTEIIVTAHGRDPTVFSLPLGAVYLSERFIKHDPPDQKELEIIRCTVRSFLGKIAIEIQPSRELFFAGTAGTITTLASIVLGLEAYNPDRINGSVLEGKAIDNIVYKLSQMTVKERSFIRGLEPGREDIILAGAIVTQEIMLFIGNSSLVVSDWGLREGIVLDLYEKLRNERLS